MTVVSIRDFRSNQSKYLGLAAGGGSVILEGTLDRNGKINFIIEGYVGSHGFFGTITPDYKTITGNCQSYHPNGRLDMDCDFTMEKE